jgi:hypothetical protein
MAAPATAPTRADLTKQFSDQYIAMLNAAVKIYAEQRDPLEKELVALLTSQRSLDKAIGEGQNNAFVKLVDVNNRYGGIVARGSVSGQDKVKYLIDILELQNKVNKGGIAANESRIDRILRDSGVTAPGQARISGNAALIWRNYIDLVGDAAYDPTLTADFQRLMDLTGYDENTVAGLEGGAGILEQRNLRIQAANSLDSAAQVIISAFGQDALSNLKSSAGSAAGIASVESKLARIPDDVYDQVRVQAGMLPGLGDSQAKRAAYDERIKVIRDALAENPETRITAIMSGIQSKVDAANSGFKSVSFKARLMGQPKFHEWAKSNGFTVGYARKADQPGDKDLPGYDSATNTVYVPGLDDERAFRAAARQAAMGPRAQALPSFMQGVRGRLPERKNLTVEVEAEASSDLAKKNADGKFRTVDGQYATDAEIQTVRDANTVTATARVGDQNILLMKDNSKSILNADGSTTPIAAGDTTYADAVFSKLPNPDVPSDAALAITEAPVPPPAKTRTIVGRETALLPSDPPGATVIETTEGRRIVIPKEKIVSSREYREGDVTSGTGAPLEGETGARGIRAPFAAARARMGGLPAVEAATPPEITPQAAAVRRVVTPTVAAPIPEAIPPRSRFAPSPFATQATPPTVAPTAVAPTPAPSVTVTPGQEAGAEVRAAAPSAMTGATAPQPVQIAVGTPAKVPAIKFAPIPEQPPAPMMPSVTSAGSAAASPRLADMPAFPVAPAPVPAPAKPSAPAPVAAPAPAPAPAPVTAAAPVPEEDIFSGATIKLEPEEVPTVAAPDTAALKSRLDALRRMRAEREAARRQALSAGVFSQ